MVNGPLFRDTVSKKGLKYQYLASEVGLSTYGLQLKIDGKNEFKASEIDKLSCVLKLSSSERDEIFFAKNVTVNQQNTAASVTG